MQPHNERRASMGLFGEPNQADPEPTHEEMVHWANSMGYTEAYYADGDTHSGSILVKPDTDLDGRFRPFCLEEYEIIQMNGSLGSFERVAL